MKNGKGSVRRPMRITEQEFSDRWDKAFGRPKRLVELARETRSRKTMPTVERQACSACDGTGRRHRGYDNPEGVACNKCGGTGKA